MRYVDRLLGAWRQAGIATVDAARADRARHAAAPAGSAASPNPAPYQQRAHDDSDYDGLCIDLDAQSP